jgi:hypothetical protein
LVFYLWQKQNQLLKHMFLTKSGQGKRQIYMCHINEMQLLDLIFVLWSVISGVGLNVTQNCNISVSQVKGSTDRQKNLTFPPENVGYACNFM